MQWNHFPVRVESCDVGRGLFATRDLQPGEPILRFTGATIDLIEALSRGETQSNPLQIGTVLYLDLEPPGVYSNHSCDPNAGIRGDVNLVALRPIAEGEEIRWDYSTSMWEACWTLPCRCRAASCRGLVTDFPQLPAAVQERYLDLGVVQSYIVRQLAVQRRFS